MDRLEAPFPCLGLFFNVRSECVTSVSLLLLFLLLLLLLLLLAAAAIEEWVGTHQMLSVAAAMDETYCLKREDLDSED